MAGKKRLDFMIVNRRTKKALQATGLDNGLLVEQAAATGSDAQLWSQKTAKGGVKLVNKASGKALDVVAEGTENGTRVQTWEDVNGESQLWQVQNVTATYKKLVNVRSGKVLDIADMSSEDGAPAQIWEDVDGAGQQWKLVSAVSPKAKKAPAKKAASKTATVKKAAPKKSVVKKASEKKTAPKAKAAPAKAAPVKAAPAEETKAPAKEAVKPAASKGGKK